MLVHQDQLVPRFGFWFDYRDEAIGAAAIGFFSD
jgi:hypothetical protein